MDLSDEPMSPLSESYEISLSMGTANEKVVRFLSLYKFFAVTNIVLATTLDYKYFL